MRFLIRGVARGLLGLVGVSLCMWSIHSYDMEQTYQRQADTCDSIRHIESRVMCFAELNRR